MSTINRYNEVFQYLEEEVIREHFNEDCSELAEKGLQIVHRYLPNEGVIIRLESYDKSYIKVPVNNELGYESFYYHEFLLIGRHVFDPDAPKKFFPALKYVGELYKLNNDFEKLICNKKCFRRLLTKEHHRELRKIQNDQTEIYPFNWENNK